VGEGAGISGVKPARVIAQEMRGRARRSMGVFLVRVGFVPNTWVGLAPAGRGIPLLDQCVLKISATELRLEWRRAAPYRPAHRGPGAGDAFTLPDLVQVDS